MTNYEMISKLDRKQLSVFLQKFAGEVSDEVCGSCVHLERCESELDDALFDCILDDTATMDAWLGMEAKYASIGKG